MRELDVSVIRDAVARLCVEMAREGLSFAPMRPIADWSPNGFVWYDTSRIKSAA